ncbi:MAG: RsmE family RNA methyltransferase [Candidatus Geothermincolia bacterium]
MGLPIFYISEDKIDGQGSTASIEGPDARHLARSLRARQGDGVMLADTRGMVYRSRIETINPESISLKLLSSAYLPPERPQVVLFQGMSKGTAMDEAVARAAESGASRLVPFVARRSPLEAVKKSSVRLERWRTIARESSKVARRTYPLEVREPVRDFSDTLVKTVGRCVILWEDEEHTAFQDALPEQPPRSIGLVAGPEGGLEPGEVAAMRAMGARPSSLGALNMRAESAGSYAVMIVRFRYGLLLPGGQAADE